MVQGTMEFRIRNEKRTMKPGDVAVIPGGGEQEGHFPEDSEAIDFFAPGREDFLTRAPPSYMAHLRAALSKPCVRSAIMRSIGVRWEGPCVRHLHTLPRA